MVMAMPMTAMAEVKMGHPGDSLTAPSYGGGSMSMVTSSLTLVDVNSMQDSDFYPVKEGKVQAIKAFAARNGYDIYAYKTSGGCGWSVYSVDSSIIKSQDIAVKGRTVSITADGTEVSPISEAGLFAPLSEMLFPMTLNNGTVVECMSISAYTGKYMVLLVPQTATVVKVGSRSADPSTAYKYNGMTQYGDCDYGTGQDYILKEGTNTASAQPQTTGATPMWKQNAKGWWLENADGTYLTNQWYLYNGQWYYMGADGYMLVSTTTPDGYWVNADGIWVQ